LNQDISYYLRMNRMPHIFCPGCGHGIAMNAIIRAIDAEELEKNEVVVVSGIGCSSRIPGYLDFNTLHTTHGRAIPFATGIKMARPDLKVIVVSGDGDATAIGGNHFIHACRRNIDLSLFVLNNNIYGMTGGQYSPTTFLGARATTAPYGNLEPEFDIAGLAAAAGASYVARATCYHALQMIKLFRDAIKNKGFSVVEVMSQCPTYYGRKNRLADPVDMINWQKEKTYTEAEAAKAESPEALEGKVMRGVIHHKERTEYTDRYQELIDRVSGSGAK
jgi:2-oxoglutarate ferredoxin oxidoreductase subunit beta